MAAYAMKMKGGNKPKKKKQAKWRDKADVRSVTKMEANPDYVAKHKAQYGVKPYTPTLTKRGERIYKRKKKRNTPQKTM